MIIKLKKIHFTYLILFMFSVLFINCEKEEDITEGIEQKEASFSITRTNQSIINENNDLKNKIDYIISSQKTRSEYQNKTVYNNQYDFSINTENITYIENNDNSYHSYTFQIERSVDNGLLENLLFSLQPDGNYKTVIVSYDITEEEKQYLNEGNQVDFIDRVIFTEINDENLNPDILITSNKATINCDISSSLECSTTACPDCNFTNTALECEIVYTANCGGGPPETRPLDTNSGGVTGSGSGYDYTSGGGGGTGSSGGSTSTPDVTVPVIEFPDDEDCPEEEKNSCGKCEPEPLTTAWDIDDVIENATGLLKEMYDEAQRVLRESDRNNNLTIVKLQDLNDGARTNVECSLIEIGTETIYEQGILSIGYELSHIINNTSTLDPILNDFSVTKKDYLDQIYRIEAEANILKDVLWEDTSNLNPCEIRDRFGLMLDPPKNQYQGKSLEYIKEAIRTNNHIELLLEDIGNSPVLGNITVTFDQHYTDIYDSYIKEIDLQRELGLNDDEIKNELIRISTINCLN